MTETWLPFAIRRPGPSAKVGYGSLKAIPLSEKEGEMKHSAEGSLAAAFGVLDNLGIQASWTGLLAKDGRVFQHYPLEAITWHGGLAGDRRTDTSLIGNLTLNGWEHEGGGPNARGEPLTEKQYQATLRVSEFTRSVMPRVGSAPPRLRRNLWEHNFVTATACPSGRIPWARLIADLTSKEEIMALVNADGRIYALGAMGKRHIGPTEYAGWRAMGFTATKVSKADLAKLPDWDDKVAATRFKPTGHPGAALKTWIGSYHTHRSTSATGRQNHGTVKKHMDDAAKHSGTGGVTHDHGIPAGRTSKS